MRRDLAARRRPDRARLGAARPLAAEGDVPPLRVPRPAQPRRHARRGAARPRPDAGGETESIPWREGAREELVLSRHRAASAWRCEDGRAAVATGDEVVVVEGSLARDPRRARRRGHRRARREGAPPRPRAGGRHADRGLPDRARPRRLPARRPRAPSTASSSSPEPAAEEETAALVRHAEAARRLAPPLRDAAARAGHGAALRRHRAAAHRRARGDGGRRRQDRHLPHGRDHGAARRAGRGARGAARSSSPARSSCSARRSRSRGSCSRSSASTPGRKGKTGYSTDARVLRAIRDDARDRRR